MLSGCSAVSPSLLHSASCLQRWSTPGGVWGGRMGIWMLPLDANVCYLKQSQLREYFRGLSHSGSISQASVETSRFEFTCSFTWTLVQLMPLMPPVKPLLSQFPTLPVMSLVASPVFSPLQLFFDVSLLLKPICLRAQDQWDKSVMDFFRKSFLWHVHMHLLDPSLILSVEERLEFTADCSHILRLNRWR